jgi:type 1 glutamine amidotransferase
LSNSPNRYTTYEEAYNFLTDPRSVNATVLLTPNASSYSDPTYATVGHYQGSPHPSVWLRDATVDLGNGTDSSVGRMTGRMWMTSLGHTNETWESEVHRSHVLEGIRWALEGTNK